MCVPFLHPFLHLSPFFARLLGSQCNTCTLVCFCLFFYRKEGTGDLDMALATSRQIHIYGCNIIQHSFFAQSSSLSEKKAPRPDIHYPSLSSSVWFNSRPSRYALTSTIVSPRHRIDHEYWFLYGFPIFVFAFAVISCIPRRRRRENQL